MLKGECNHVRVSQQDSCQYMQGPVMATALCTFVSPAATFVGLVQLRLPAGTGCLHADYLA